ncbi:MAG TPA: hypothetical protein VHF25_01375 [Nitriliruptorales bacterium]|nr:hypothetical protein [Nitriliruptorales bacterium]
MRRLPLLLVAALVLSGCAAEVVAGPAEDATLAVAAPPAPPSPSPTSDLDRRGIQDTLDAVAAAFRARDGEALRPWLHDPSSPFGRRWEQRASNLRAVPLARYELELDASLPDLATDRVRERYQTPVAVVYVVERHALEGHDDEGPAVDDLFLTVVRDDDGRWKVADDADADPLGLVSADHVWDRGPVQVTSAPPFLALYHPETAASIPVLLEDARAGLEQMRAHWSLPWSGEVPLIVPRDQEELAALLHVTFELDDFIAFASATADVELGTYRLTGTRLLVNTERFLERPSDLRRSVFAHELLHVASRPHSGPLVPSWVEEGLAQRLGERRSTTGTHLLSDVVGRGFDGAPPEDAAFVTGGRDSIFLSYQLAWSFADFLAGRFGEEALARFYRSLGRGAVGEPGREAYHLDRAARDAFGTGLKELQAAWAAALRSK